MTPRVRSRILACVELSPAVLVVVVVVVAVSFVLVRWGRRHEAASPEIAPAAPGKRAPTATEEWESEALVTWLLDRAFEQTGVRVADDALARERIVQAAVQAMENLRDGRSASISLPFLAADAQGPKHFGIEFKQNPDATFELQR